MFRVQGYLAGGKGFSRILEVKSEEEARNVLSGMVLGLEMARETDWQVDLVRDKTIVAIEYPGKPA